MSERGRASLSSLKRPLVQPAAPAVPLEFVEEQLLGPGPAASPAPQPEASTTAGASLGQPPEGPSAGQPVVPSQIPTTVPHEVHTAVLPDILLNRKAREPLTAWTLKLPVSLHRELRAVARYNDIGMTSIVIDALRHYLPNFPHPPAPPSGQRD